MRLSLGVINISKKKETARVIVLVVIFALAVNFIWRHYHRNNMFVPASPAKIEQNSKSYNANLLQNGDLKSYQRSQADIAGFYLNKNDLNNADKVMQEVFKKVPAGKIISDTYATMVQLEKAKKDTMQYKHYMELYISQLKKEGQNDAAAQQQKILDSGL